MTARTESPWRLSRSRDWDSIPILVFGVGLARSVLMTAVVFFLVILAAAFVAFLMFG